jgi:hypothetical protein
MPFIFTRTKVPKEKTKRLQLINSIAQCMNLFMTLAYNFTLFYNNWTVIKTGVLLTQTSDLMTFIYTVTHYSVGGLQLVSGVVLLVAVYKIIRFLFKQGLQKEMNYKSMIVNSVSFSLYNISVIVLYVAYLIYTLEKLNNDNAN